MKILINPKIFKPKIQIYRETEKLKKTIEEEEEETQKHRIIE